MPECIRIIPRAKLTRIADLTGNAPEWDVHLKLLSAEGCLCIMHGDDDPPDKYYLILFDYPSRFRSFCGDLCETEDEVRLITNDTGYVFAVTDRELTEEKAEMLRGQLRSMQTLIEAENTINNFLNKHNSNETGDTNELS
ncbi:MAG: hypothetical protein MJ079_06485 [Ruminococcus sp.]|nr:hypothetical protein [Ruminococcus sp.]